jgi:FADH2 O2-dependent halogenase
MEAAYDIAIVGSGFAGSLLAMIARRLGRSVILLERGRHPRVVIGESSTPLTDLLLEELADRYQLDEVRPLCKWGSWRQTHPELACGLKRGFTFYHHHLDQPAAPDPEHRDQLLVAASPGDRIADTHWYRADLDHFLVQAAQRAGVEYVDDVHLERFIDEDSRVLLEGARHGRPFAIRARFVVDATGPRGFLHRALELGELPLPGMPATQALYSHFTGVGRLSDAQTSAETPPYPPDDAAVHHVFPGGWIWVLHFNNGITSAGVAATDAVAERFGFSEGRAGWDRLLSRIPALREQFSRSHPGRPFTHIPRLSFRSARIAGRNWALLPSAAGFVDPLLSTGFPLTLHGVQRLAAILESNPSPDELPEQLSAYTAQTDAELLAVGRLAAALYAGMENFRVFADLTMLYFAAVSYAETAHRLGRPQLAPSFLLHDHPVFGPAMQRVLAESYKVHTAHESERFSENVRRAIEPINVAGLCDPRRRNWYPVDAQDLFDNAHKLHATREEIESLLKRCGFAAESNLE